MKNTLLAIVIILEILTLSIISLSSYNFFHFIIKHFGFGVVTSFIFSFVFIITSSFLIILHINKHLIKKRSMIFFSIFFLLYVISITFWKNPIYPQDFENNNKTILLSADEVNDYIKISTAQTTCFFLATCPFCEISSDYLNNMYISGQIKDIKIIYYAYQSTADSIVKSRGIKIPYEVLEDDSFFKFSGNSFPVILHRNNDKIMKWKGNDVNFACYDYIKASQ